MVKETLGDDWLTPDLFRFGASTLVNDVLMQIAKTVGRQLPRRGLFLATLTHRPAGSLIFLPLPTAG